MKHSKKGLVFPQVLSPEIRATLAPTGFTGEMFRAHLIITL